MMKEKQHFNNNNKIETIKYKIRDIFTIMDFNFWFKYVWKKLQSKIELFDRDMIRCFV